MRATIRLILASFRPILLPMRLDRDVVPHRLTDEEQDRLLQGIPAVLTKYPWVQAAYLYGSAARKQPARDIDIGLLADPIPDWGAESKIGTELRERTGITSIEFDVRFLNSGSPVFLNNVLRDGKCVFEQNRKSRIEFEVRAMALWLDFQPVWDRLRKQVLKRWSRA